MKLVSFRHRGMSRIGVVMGDSVVDGDADPELPREMCEFLAAGDDAIDRLRRLAGSADNHLPLDEVELLAPVGRPPKFLAVSLNYESHIAETGLERPEFPSFFNKQSTCVIGPGQEIHRPRVSEKLDYEGELGFVIGRRCRHVPRHLAHEVIAGYTIVNDVSVRDWQVRSPTMTLGKSFDTHGPIGPWIVTPDELPDVGDLEIQTWVNEERRQCFSTSGMIFGIEEMIETLTTAFTLEPGDIIATGTGPGVGVKMKPRGYLKPGDTVRVRIEGIGELANPVVLEPEDTALIL